MREDSGHNTWLNRLALDFVPIGSALKFRRKQSAKTKGQFLNTGEVLRAHGSFGEQTSIAQWITKWKFR